MPRARKLQVFEARIGFYDTIVAAPSRAAALRAWGTHQDLFANGEARVASDKAAIAAALEHPEQPLRRALGSKDGFALEPASLPQIPDAPKRQNRPVGKPVTPPRPVADRTALTAAETALREIDAKGKREAAEIQKEAEVLEARRRAAQEAYARKRKQATDRLNAARVDYKKAGGTD